MSMEINKQTANQAATAVRKKRGGWPPTLNAEGVALEDEHDGARQYRSGPVIYWEVAATLSELRDCLDSWNLSGWNLNNSRKYRSIAKRVVLASRSLEQVVKENTFSRP